MVLLEHAVGRVQLLDVSIVGVEVGSERGVALVPAVAVVGFSVVPAALGGEK